MNKQQIFWFQDGLKLQSSQSVWPKIDIQSESLIRSIGHPEFRHIIVDPTTCTKELFSMIEQADERFSVIIDTTQQLQRVCESLFPTTPLIQNIHISRIRKVTSSRLDGAGFLINSTSKERDYLKKHFDLRRPLVLDDVGWSGRSAITISKILNLDLNTTSFGFLVSNDGVFGEKGLGAKRFLEQKGATVFSGMEVYTPNDDGFHLSDFSIPQTITKDSVWNLLGSIQKLREQERTEPVNCDLIHTKIHSILRDNSDILFPHAMNAQRVKTLQEEGKIVGFNQQLYDDSLFDTNPPNWLMPSLSKRIQSEQIMRNTTEIHEALRFFLNIQHETTNEITNEFRRKECC